MESSIMKPYSLSEQKRYMANQILFTGGTLHKDDKLRLENMGYTVRIERPDLTEDELIKALEGISAYILGGSEKASRRVIEATKDLKVIAFFGVGYESFVDVIAATERGIAVTNTPKANSRSVAEFTMALMLSAVKQVVYLVDSTKHGIWKEYSTWNLEKKTLGIVGLGTIGSYVARMAYYGFGMNVLYTGRNAKPDIEEELHARFVPLEELLQKSDIVSLHVSTNDKTRGMIGEEEFHHMKTTSVLINTARAELVDPKALRQALLERKIAIAAFDGYYQEPVPSVAKDVYGLVGLSDEFMLISPHTAYLTDDATCIMTDISIDNIVAALEGRVPIYVVNPRYREHLNY